MAYIELNRQKLRHNYQVLDEIFRKEDRTWAVVTKILCGHPEYLKEVLDLGVEEVCDSRISNLKMVKKLRPDVQTVYIKPPAKRLVEKIIRYADVTFNSETETIRMLSDEAVRQGKTHKITIMIELGDLREGIMGENLLGFYEQVFELPNIKVVAIGTNLNCLHGVMPSEDKLIQLSLYKQLVETKFNQSIPYITGGTSVVLPLLRQHRVPKAINHFRIGEALFFGNDLFTGGPVPDMEQQVFKFYSEIIEITEKPIVPTGMLAENPSGDTFEIEPEDYGKTSCRAIIDVGLLDIPSQYLVPIDPNLEIINASSDMLIIDLGENKGDYKVGNLIEFDLVYMGALALLNSKYIDKKIV
ncbi:MAG: alanine/ornithine racemase family PLP-dependent enzyme [Saprospiraceae bacterium]|nr:alanine/ornithine racemase family PLP-dependent enzyme [Saprospiraceae bacterium]